MRGPQMTAQQLREKLVRAFATELALDTDGAHDFANVLIAIICSQREALEEYSRKRPAKMGGLVRKATTMSNIKSQRAKPSPPQMRN
jgi:hypothetical protein